MGQWDEMSKILDDRDFLRKRIIYLDGQVGGEMARAAGKAIVWLNALDSHQEITLYIDSGGGSVVAGLDIYDAVRHSQAPVTGIVYRYANSMAALILQACRIRKALRHSVITIHNIDVTKSLSELEESPDEALKDTRKDQQIIYEIIAARSGMPIDEVRKRCKEGKTMSAAEAKEANLIDEII